MKRVSHVVTQYGETVPLLRAMAQDENVQDAYRKAIRCKRYRNDILELTNHKEEILVKVQNEILTLSYHPGAYHYFKVYEPKERQIMSLPIYDRVVQHAINNVIEPIFDKRFIFHSYACRSNKGIHMASDTLQRWLYEWALFHPEEHLYCIKADIHHYFQSIDHQVLKDIIRRVIKDTEKSLILIDRIIDHNGTMPDGVGIPVGNLTSQLFANIYLDELDKFVKHTLGVKYYIRYMDDFVILSPDKEQLRIWLDEIEKFLHARLHLALNPNTTLLFTKNGVDFVGYKHMAAYKKLRPRSVTHAKHAIAEYERGAITEEQLKRKLASWEGHASHADTFHLVNKINTMAKDAIQNKQKNDHLNVTIRDYEEL